MKASTPSRTKGGLAATALAILSVASAQAAPHEHGGARLDVALDGATLSVALEAPLDSLLGFERAPRSAAERQAVAALRERLRQGAELLRPSPEAECRQTEHGLEAPVLDGRAAGAHEHADLEARWTFRCERPQQLRALDLALFQAFARLQRLEVQLVTAKGQAGRRLQRPAGRLGF